ncbi:MAG TPA: adenosylcobinamide-GDP ribazoletransferase [Streptosporangiaceae bacterium]
MRRSGLGLAVTLLTVLPWPGPPPAAEPGQMIEPGRAMEPGRTMEWAPAVGLLLGALSGAVLFAAGDAAGAGALTGAALAVATLALLTRGLHLDGLADLADGLGSGKRAGQALEIMRKSDIGPMGVAAIGFAVLIQVASLAHAHAGWRGALVLVTAVTTGRLAITWACCPGVPAARPEGLGALVAGTARPVLAMAWTVVIGIAAGVAAGGLRPGLTLGGGVVAGLACAWLLRRHAVRRLGGITGDVLGALAEVATTVTLVVATCGRLP